MNLIHGALFAVLTFMGSISLSAQNWFPPAQAAIVIEAQLNVLSEPPALVSPSQSLITKQQISSQNAQLGCPDCLSKNVKYLFLKLVIERLKNGEETGEAVGAVRSQMISNSNNNATMLATIQSTYEYILGILS